MATKTAEPQDDQRRKVYDDNREVARMTAPEQYKRDAIEPDRGIAPNIREKETRPDWDPKSEPGKEVAPEDISVQEEAGEPEQEPSYYSPDKERETKRLWNREGRRRPKPLSGHKKGKFVAIGIGGFLGSLLLIGLIAIVLFLLAPYKEVHFAEVLRSIYFARFTQQINRQFSRVIFDAAVLTERSTGTYPRDGFLNRLPLVNPARQVQQLGREGAVRWDFDEQRRWGGLLTGENVYRGVEIFGQNFSLDEAAQELYGRNYSELNGFRQYKVRGRHTNQVRQALATVIKPLGRSRYVGTTIEFNRIVGARLAGWFDRAKPFRGTTLDQARVLNIEQDLERTRSGNTVKTGLTDVDEDAEERNRQAISDAKSGRPTDYTGKHRGPYVGTHRESPGQIRNRLAARLKVIGTASDAVFAITLACVIHSLSNAFEEHERAREEQVGTWGNLVLSKADQTKAGAVEAEAINAESSMWHGAEQAYLYAAAYNRPLTPDMEVQAQAMPWVSIQNKFSSAVQITDQILTGSILDLIPGFGSFRQDGITKACDIALKEPVQIGTAAAEIAISAITAGATKGGLAALRKVIEGGLAFAVGYGVSEWIGQQLDNMIETASNLDFTGAHTGSQRFNESAIGVDYIQQASNRNITFGAPLNQQQANDAQELAVTELKDYYNDQSFVTRYFALDNPFSLAGQVVARTPDSATAVADQARQGLASIGSILAAPARLLGSIASIFTGGNLAKAAPIPSVGTSFGVDQWGWSVEEQIRIENDTNFLPENLANIVEPRLDELNDRYWDCYDVNEYALQADKPEKCTREFLSTNDALYWRYYMFYLYVMSQLTGDL